MTAPRLRPDMTGPGMSMAGMSMPGMTRSEVTGPGLARRLA